MNAQKTQNKNLTQSKLRPVSPFSYVGQGRKGKREEGRKKFTTEQTSPGIQRK
jgi:hypothetical protein